MSARVLVLLDNPFTHDARVEREARSLANAGYRVTVLCFEGPGLPHEEERDGIRILRVPRLRPPRLLPPGLRLAWYLTRLARDGGLGPMERRASTEEADLVHACDLRTLPLGARLARRMQARLVYDCHDLWADLVGRREARSPWQWLNDLLRRQVWRRLEKRLAPKPDACITVCDGLAEVLRERGYPAPAVVRNCPETVEATPKDRLRELCGWGDGVRLLLYLGGVSVSGRGLRTAVAALALLPERYVLTCVGPGNPKSVEHAAREQGVLDRVRVLPPVPPKEIVPLAAGADAGLCLIEPENISKRLALPNKLFEYMMAGLPQVVTDLPEMRRVIETERVGAVIPAQPSPEEVAAAARGLVESPDYETLCERARSAARERHNWSIEAEKLLALYARVLKETS